jgi:hypothetical protein
VEGVLESIEKEIEELVEWMVAARVPDLETIEDGLKEKGNKLLLKVHKGGPMRAVSVSGGGRSEG